MKKKSLGYSTSIHPIGVTFVAIIITSYLFTHQVAAEGSFFQSPSQPQVEATPTVAVVAPTATLLPPTVAPIEPTSLEEETPPVEEEAIETSDPDSNLIFDQAEFIDTVVIFFSWIWLCCGIGIFLTVPLILLLLQIRGGVKLRRQRKSTRDN